MFGFLAPARRLPEYRRGYARICQTQRRLFGVTSVAFLSYEAVFLYQMAVEDQLIPSPPDDGPECCRLRRMRHPDSQADRTALEYCAAFGLILAGIKLQDDEADHGRWYNYAAERWYRGAVAQAEAHLERFLPGLADRTRGILANHRVLEDPGAPPPLLEDYVKPTGDGFALYYRGLADILSGDKPHYERRGRAVGEALISWDCASDYHRDRIRGEFNPLRHESQIGDAFRFCRLRLMRLDGLLGASSSACRPIVEQVSARVDRRMQNPKASCRTTRLERWGFLRARGYQYARCDGCEALCACGECAECAACGADAGGTACCALPSLEAGCCCADVFLCWGEPRQKSQPAAGTRDEGIYAAFVSREAVTAGVLNPEGYVHIDGQMIPAHSESGQFIAEHRPVTIMSADNLGVRVLEKR